MKSILFTIIIRGFSSLLALAFTTVAVRYLGGTASGELFTSIAYIMLLSTFISFGSNGMIMREASKNQEVTTNFLEQFIKRQLINFVKLSIVMLSLYMTFDISIEVFFAALFYSLSQMLYFHYISIGKVNLSYVFFMWVPNAYMIFFIYYSQSGNFEFHFLVSYMLSFCSLYIGLLILSKKNGGNNRAHNKINYNNSKSYFIQDIIGQLFNSIFLVIASNFLIPSDLSRLTIYQKLSSVSNIMIGIISLSTFKNATEGIKNKHTYAIYVCNNNAKLLIPFLFIYIVLLFFLWEPLIQLFNINSMDYNLILLLMIAYIFVAYSNSSTLILNTFGGENILRNLSIINFLLSISLMIVLGYYLLLPGLVIALSFSLIFQSVVQRKVLHKLFKA